MALRPGGRILRALLHTKESIGVEPQAPAPEITKGVQRVANLQPHASEARVEPVDRGLALLEVVQIHPSPLHTILAKHWRGGAPVGVLETWLVEDHPLHPANDVAVLGSLVFRLAIEIDRIATLGHS